MASSLAFVPTDILTPILAFIDCVSLIRVYKCGDGRLNDRLLRSVTRFDLIYSNYVTMKFPIIIRQFTGLKSLSVQLHTRHGTPKCDYDLTSLPNSLTSLHVPQERPLFEFQISSSYRKLQTHVVNLSATFPNLTSLVTPSGNYEPTEAECLEWIEKLPGNLIEMCMRNLSLGPEHVAALPRFLDKLTVRLAMKEADKRDWNFPPDLRHLSLPCRILSVDFEKYLPLKLESLHLVSTREVTRTYIRFEKLPRSLKVLDGVSVRVSSSDCFDSLPNYMERLMINYAIIETTDVVYPACLKEIPVSSSLSESQSVAFIKSLPSEVEKMEVNHSIFSAEWHLLPRKMKKMSIRAATVLNDEHAAHLPPDLEEMIIYKPSDRFLELLPKNITTLAIAQALKPFNPSILNTLYHLKTLDLKTNVNVNVSDFTNFTIKLTSLSLPCTLGALELRLPWASELTFFHARPFTFASSTQGTPSYPSKYAHDDGIQQTDPFEAMAWWKHFSHTLTSINIYEHNSSISSSHISLLPPHLTTMQIPGIFFDEDLSLSLKRLPRSLTIVDFHDAVYRPGAKQSLGEIQDLPSNLTRLALKRLANVEKTVSRAKQVRPWLRIEVYN